MKLVSSDGSHKIDVEDDDTGNINTYRAHGYATAEEHAAGAKAAAAHAAHMKAMGAEAPGTSNITPKTAKAQA